MLPELKEIRQEIDLIDDRIKALYERRMKLVLDIAEIKAERNLPVLDVARESEIISRLTKGQDDDMTEVTKALFAVVFEASRSYQAKKSGLKQ